ncbi:MAG: threonyl-tRNA synthetase [Candidatus Woesearchaeota archaeon]|jgi:threonyl-tRNA synthetase
MVTVTLPDNTIIEVLENTSILDLVKEHIGEGLARAAIVAEFNGQITDLTTPLTENGNLTIYTFKDEKGKETFWHSSAHILANAVKRLFPDAKLTIGPAISEGFYYDFQTKEPFTEADLEKIQAEMKNIVKEDLPFVKKNITKDEALALYKDNEFKTEIVHEYSDSQLTAYSNGAFIDMCRGPHVLNTSRIKALKLTKLSGAYWRGDATKPQLQRIYGISFPNKDDLKVYNKRIEEAKTRDHRKIMLDLNLAWIHEYAPGMPFFLPSGAAIYNELIAFIRSEYIKRGYQEVITPQMFNKKLWETSGHWDHYKDDMFIFNIEGQEFSLKPMNCPSHCLLYNRDKKSYRDLPLRIADFCNLHRNELTGALSGLTRVRKFAQDDAHIFCTLDQVEEEVLGVLNFIKYVWEDVFDFKLTYYLSTRPTEKLGTDELWDKSEAMLKAALEKANISYELKVGDGAFYGPKIDIDLEDALGRKWQCPTCQLDFNLPERFGCEYEGSDGQVHQAVMIHRAVLGSLERFLAMLFEHTKGKFPLWLSPVQVKILTIADRHVAHAEYARAQLQKQGIRAEIDSRVETINKKVREAQLAQINYILVVGDKEVETESVNVRTRDNEVHGAQNINDFVTKLVTEVRERK